MLSEQKMKNLIDKKHKETKLPKQQLYGLFALEQFLLKLNHSPYQENIILKGGFLLSILYGLENRATRDLDATVREKDLTRDMIMNLAKYVENKSVNTECYFKYIGIRETRENFDYNGFELKMQFINGRSRFPLSIDFTTGEELVSVQEGNQIPLLFSKESTLTFTTYSLEQILTDKFYTTIAYGKYDDSNSRMKDYYDIYLLTSIEEKIDYSLIVKGLYKTMKQRNEQIKSSDYLNILYSASRI